MEEEKKQLIGTSDVGKTDSDQQPSKHDDVLSPSFAPIGGKLEETQSDDSAAIDCFYEKVCKLCESSGIPVIEETKMDLYKLYKEVIERGGFQKVLKGGKWNEVTSWFNSSCSSNTISMEASDLRNIYSNILYNYEQIYHYRSPKKEHSTTTNFSTVAKRKYSEISCLPTTYDNTKTTTTIPATTTPATTTPATTIPVNKKNSPKKTEEKFKREKGAPMSPRNAYQMYLRIECVRLKNMHKDGEDKTSGNQNFRDIAIESWRNLSQEDRQPYVEESKKDKERFNEEMAAYQKSKKKKTENITSEKKTENIPSEKKTENITSEKKTENTTSEKKTENTSEKKAENATSEKKTENTTSEKKTESSLQQKKEDDHVMKLDSVPNESASATVADESMISEKKTSSSLQQKKEEDYAVKLVSVPNESASAAVDDESMTSEKNTESSLQQKKEDDYVMKLDSVPNESASAAVDDESTTSEKKTSSSLQQKKEEDYVMKLDSVPNESASATVDDESTIKMAKNAEQSSSLFQVTWDDGHGSLDLT